MKYNVTEVEFDFDDDYAEESKLTFDEERSLIEGIQSQIYDVKEEELLRVIGILKAQAKQPTMEWN